MQRHTRIKFWLVLWIIRLKNFFSSKERKWKFYKKKKWKKNGESILEAANYVYNGHGMLYHSADRMFGNSVQLQWKPVARLHFTSSSRLP